MDRPIKAASAKDERIDSGGPPCPEAQADGVPCEELGRDCEDCERGHPDETVEPAPSEDRG
jgi:hypothetical protein